MDREASQIDYSRSALGDLPMVAATTTATEEAIAVAGFYVVSGNATMTFKDKVGTLFSGKIFPQGYFLATIYEVSCLVSDDVILFVRG